MKPTTVVFDFDGTLADTLLLALAVLKKTSPDYIADEPLDIFAYLQSFR